MNKVAQVSIDTQELVFPEGTEGGKWVLYVESTEKPPQHEGKYMNARPAFTVPVVGGNTYKFKASRVDSDDSALLGPMVEAILEVPGEGTGEVLIEVAKSLSAVVVDGPEPK